MQYPTFTQELNFLKTYKYVAGIDEAGRGPLAGPVVASCVILNPKSITDLDKNSWHKTIRDSKKMTQKQREKSFEDIKKNALSYGIGQASHIEIDKINILQATYLAMKRAIENCKIKPEFIFVDGNQEIPNSQIKQKTIIKGDSSILSIACASILAKVTRDAIMLNYHKKYPKYRFDKHKGYGTLIHREMIKKYGVCPIHRKSFLKKLLNG